MLLIVEKAIRGRICHSIYSYTKVNKEYMKYYDKNKELSYLKINKLHGWAMSQKLPENPFEWIEDTFHFNKDLIKRIYWRKLWKTFFWNKIYWNIRWAS